MQTIPTVDMDLFLHGTPEQKLLTAKKFGEALQKIGFVAITSTGVSSVTIDKAYLAAEQYFKLPEKIKLKTRTANQHHGFTPFGTEHAKYTPTIDLKEFFQTTGPSHPDNVWPDDFEFKNTILKLYSELENCMKHCLQATAIYLGYTDEKQQTILSDMLGEGHGVMRILHYPPVDPTHSPKGAVRSAPHEDLGIMTIIPRTTRPGLQVLTHDNQWIDVVIPHDAAIVNSGDVLNLMTNGLIPSTTHRVINPDDQDYSDRYSIPFFGNLIPTTRLSILDRCRNNNKLSEEETTFSEFMLKRYHDIGLKN